MIASLIGIAFALTCNAQVRLVESLPDGSHVVEINGVEFRALGAEKMRELQKQKAELEATKQINTELGTQIKEALLQRDLAKAQKDLEAQRATSFEADFNRAKEDAARWHNLFTEERTLRREASQFIGRASTPKGFMGKVLTFLDSPASQAAFKIGIPIYQMVRCSQ